MSSAKRLYTIKELAEVVGMSTSALRAWERRFALFEPERTPGGHRLYTDDDLKLLWFVRRRQEEGVDLRSIAAAGRAVLLDEARRHFDSAGIPDHPGASEAGVGCEVLEMLQQGNVSCAARTLLRLRTVTATLEVFCQKVFLIHMEISFAYSQRKISTVAYAGFCEILRSTFRSVLLEGPCGMDAPVAAVASVDPALDDVALLWIAALLRCWGYAVTLLGSAAPVMDLHRFVIHHPPHLLVIGGRWPAEAESAERWIRELGMLVAPHCVTVLSAAGTQDSFAPALLGRPETANLFLLETVQEIQDIAMLRKDDPRPAAQFLDACRESFLGS